MREKKGTKQKSFNNLSAHKKWEKEKFYINFDGSLNRIKVFFFLLFQSAFMTSKAKMEVEKL